MTISEPPDHHDVPPLGDDDIDHTERLVTQEPGMTATDDDDPIEGYMTPEQVTARHKQLSQLPTIPTGFGALDALLDGMRPTQQYVLAAATGNGKTSFVLWMATQYEGPVLIWTREMDPHQLQARIVAQLSGKDSNAILRGEMNDDDYAAQMSPYADRVRYYSGDKLNDFERAVERVAMEAKAHGLEQPVLVVIDYLQKLAPATAHVREAITEASEAMRRLTQKYGLVTWIVSAVGRDAARRIRLQRNIDPGDLVDVCRESGSIEYDCAGMLVLGLEPENADSERHAVISVAKNRFGRLGQVEYLFVGETGQFKELGMLVSKAKRDRRELWDRILEAVEQADKSPNKTQISKIIGGRKQATLKEIDAMVEAGELEKHGSGYRPSTKAPSVGGDSDE